MPRQQLTASISSAAARQKGYSLIEMAVVLGIFALVAGGLLSVGTVKKERENHAALTGRFDAIEEALLHYLELYSYLPCPASLSQAENTASFGKSTDCTAAAPAGTADAGAGSDAIRIGAIPVRSLGLPDTSMYDPWGNRITYAAIKELAEDSATFSGFTTSATTGVIQITDYNGNQVNNNTTDTVIGYILVSHGKDGKGGYNRQGTVTTACDAATKDGENCDSDTMFRDTDITDSETAANYFHDYARWKEVASMVTYTTESEEEIPHLPISVGQNYTCAGKSDGTVWCWGSNSATHYKLGDGTGTQRNSPVQVAGMTTNNVGGSTGVATTCMIKNDATLWCWGNNGFYQLGDGTTNPTMNPVQAAGVTNVESVTIGSTYNCILKTDGTVWCWGENSLGQLGDNSTTTRTSPVQVSGLTNVEYIDADDSHTCAVKSDTTLWCWGGNANGKLGDGTTTNRWVPVQVFIGVSTVAANYNHTCALKTNGSVWCWGDNTNGQIGDGTTGTDRTTPVQVSGLGAYAATAVDAGYNTSCAIKTDGTLWCWGLNNHGQLGDNSTTQRTTPVQVSGLAEVTEIETVANHICAKKSDDTVWCWGRGSSGQIGDGDTDSEWVPVQVGSFP